jgi:hypothetical protein
MMSRGTVATSASSALRKERAESFAATFAADAYIGRSLEVKIVRREVEDFLNARAGVVQHRQQHVVSFPMDMRAIHLRQDVRELVLGQVAECGAEPGTRKGELGTGWTTAFSKTV